MWECLLGCNIGCIRVYGISEQILGTNLHEGKIIWLPVCKLRRSKPIWNLHKSIRYDDFKSPKKNIFIGWKDKLMRIYLANKHHTSSQINLYVVGRPTYNFGFDTFSGDDERGFIGTKFNQKHLIRLTETKQVVQVTFWSFFPFSFVCNFKPMHTERICALNR